MELLSPLVSLVSGVGVSRKQNLDTTGSTAGDRAHRWFGNFTPVRLTLHLFPVLCVVKVLNLVFYTS